MMQTAWHNFFNGFELLIMALKKGIGVMFCEQKGKPDAVPPLRRMGFAITYKCDGNCSYCFTKPDKAFGGNRVLKEFSKGEFEGILRQAIPLGLEEVQLSGGEPLLKEDRCDFVKIAKRLGVKVGIFTNGSFLGAKALISKGHGQPIRSCLR